MYRIMYFSISRLNHLWLRPLPITSQYRGQEFPLKEIEFYLLEFPTKIRRTIQADFRV